MESSRKLHIPSRGPTRTPRPSPAPVQQKRTTLSISVRNPVQLDRTENCPSQLDWTTSTIIYVGSHHQWSMGPHYCDPSSAGRSGQVSVVVQEGDGLSRLRANVPVGVLEQFPQARADGLYLHVGAMLGRQVTQQERWNVRRQVTQQERWNVRRQVTQQERWNVRRQVTQQERWNVRRQVTQQERWNVRRQVTQQERWNVRRQVTQQEREAAGYTAGTLEREAAGYTAGTLERETAGYTAGFAELITLSDQADLIRKSLRMEIEFWPNFWLLT